MYKPSINRLVEQTNKTLYSMIAKEMPIKANASDWDLKVHHVMWVYNSTLKTTIGFSPFRLAYDIKDLLLIDLQTYNPSYCYKNTIGFG